MQRQLLVAQVEADQFGQERVGVVRQRQLHRSLREVRVGTVLPMVAAIAGKQLPVQQHVVLRRRAAAKFFEVGAHERSQPRVVRALQQAVQPGAIDQFGRRHRAQKMHGVRAATEIAPRRARVSPVQVAAKILRSLRMRVAQHARQQTQFGGKAGVDGRCRLKLFHQKRARRSARQLVDSASTAAALSEQREVKLPRGALPLSRR